MRESIKAIRVTSRVGKNLGLWGEVVNFLGFSVQRRMDTKLRPRKNILCTVTNVTLSGIHDVKTQTITIKI